MILLWIATCISIFSSIVRALDIGYSIEMYILSCIAQICLIYESFQIMHIQQVTLNCFYLAISLLGLFKRFKVFKVFKRFKISKRI